MLGTGQESARTTRTSIRGTGWQPLRLAVAGSNTEARLFNGAGEAAVIAVGGMGGGFDSPAMNLYDTLGGELQGLGISVLRIRFRSPGDLASCVDDVLAGAAYLRARGVKRIGLVGHSFGGAVVLTVAGREPLVSVLVTLATQSAGVDMARTGASPLLLVHGLDDEVLPAAASQRLREKAVGEAELLLLPDAGHGLDEAAETVRERTQEWLVDHLA